MFVFILYSVGQIILAAIIVKIKARKNVVQRPVSKEKEATEYSDTNSFGDFEAHSVRGSIN